MTENAEEKQGVVGYIAYMGKRLREGKLRHNYIECDEKGEALSTFTWLTPKFVFTKRPVVGVIYKVVYADESKQSVLTSQTEYVDWHPSRKTWEIEHKTALVADETIRLLNQKLSKEAFDNLSLSEFRMRYKHAPKSQRVAMLAVLLEFLQS